MFNSYNCFVITLSVVRVIIHNVREATEEEVGEILARFGVVKEVKWNYLAPDPDLPGLEKKKDGTLTARVQLEEGKPSLPSYIRRVVDGRKEACALKFQGQGMGGCWKCGDLRHLGRQCVKFTPTPMPAFG